jgi:hypothetical protein
MMGQNGARLLSLPRHWSSAAWLNLLVKVGLIGLLLFAVFNQDMQQFEGKAMTGRALTYPIAIVVVPVVWFLLRRSRPHLDYPHVLDLLLGLPFLIDTLGNALDLYDSITWWDDLNHFGNWAILSAAFAQLLLRFDYGRWTMAALIVGFGSVSGVIWEIAEYFTFVRGGPEEATAYTDTLGDLSLDLGGALLAAAVTVLWLMRRPPLLVGTLGKSDLSALQP